MENYRKARRHWETSIGVGVRALLSLENSSGAWLWFESAVEEYGLNLDKVNIGEVVTAMLIYKLHNHTDICNRVDVAEVQP